MLNIQRLKEFQDKLEASAKEELKKEILEGFHNELIEFTQTGEYINLFVKDKIKADLSVSSRVLNNWEQHGIISRIPQSEGKLRKFNRIEIMWLLIVEVLRDFGVGLDVIEKVRKKTQLKKVKDFTPLSHAFLSTILGDSYMLIVLNGGESYLLSKKLYLSKLENYIITPHITIDLQYILSKEYPNNNFDLVGIEKLDIKGYSEKDIKLLYFIRTGDFEEIKIKVKDGEAHLIEGKRKLDKNSKLFEILKHSAYQDIEIKQEAGKVIHISSKEKIKL